MQVYIRKLYNGHYYLISGRPENHRNNTIVEEFYTRRQAIRHAAKSGYDLIIQTRTPISLKEAA